MPGNIWASSTEEYSRKHKKTWLAGWNGWMKSMAKRHLHIPYRVAPFHENSQETVLDIHPIYDVPYQLCLFVTFSHVSSKPLSLNPQQGRAQLANTDEKWSKYKTWFRGNPTGAIPATTLSAAVFTKYWPIIKKKFILQTISKLCLFRDFLSAYLSC